MGLYWYALHWYALPILMTVAAQNIRRHGKYSTGGYSQYNHAADQWRSGQQALGLPGSVAVNGDDNSGRLTISKQDSGLTAVLVSNDFAFGIMSAMEVTARGRCRDKASPSRKIRSLMAGQQARRADIAGTFPYKSDATLGIVTSSEWQRMFC